MVRFICFLCLFFMVGCSTTPKNSLVDVVNPHIGTISHLLTTPTAEVYLPHSMMHIAPITVPGVNDKFLAQKIYGFPIGNASFMPVTQKYGLTPEACASSFDRDFEIVKPYYLNEQLDDHNISVEATVQPKSAWYRINWPNPGNNYLVFFVQGNGNIQMIDSLNIAGNSFRDGTVVYFHVRFSASYSIERIFSGPENSKTYVLQFKSDNVSAQASLSYIGTDQAERNLNREIGRKSFDDIKTSAKHTWNKELNKIRITTEDKNAETVFYTAMYRALYSMHNVTEDGSYFSIFDRKVHGSEGRDFFTSDGLWDSYRVKHPLQLILNPEQQEDMLESYARMYKQYGTMPVFPFPKGELTFMLGNHLAIFAADAWNKGYKNFDLKTIYEGLRKNSLERTMLPDVNAPKTTLDDFYQENGYFPALRETDTETEPVVSPFYRRQAVAITLENSMDDYCISIIAKELNKKKDEELFLKRANNYKNLFNPAIGFMSPKLASGEWVPAFNPMTGGRQAGRDYFAECNSWVYTFHVQHDVEGLIELFGGRQKFISKLDSLFLMQYPGYKFDFQKQFPDMTGLTGMHSQGNEPAFHIPYLYCYAGEPWKTQKIIRQIMKAWYFNHPMGLCGDDDDGTLSSWYVFSALGFYPVAPGMPYYVIGSPVFNKSDIKLANGKIFTIKAKNNSAQNKYVQCATLRGQDWDKPWFTHAEMMEGGTLELTMGPKPNKKWGFKPQDAPPSMSNFHN